MKIPKSIVLEINSIVDSFNSKTFKNVNVKFIPVVKKDYLYLHRKEGDNIEPIVRLKYTGNFEDWKFAIFKYSTETYDEEDIFFPGAEYIDGTVKGALKAGNDAYPV